MRAQLDEAAQEGGSVQTLTDSSNQIAAGISTLSGSASQLNAAFTGDQYTGLRNNMTTLAAADRNAGAELLLLRQ